jgi:thiol-disulfide isomerase/thioredoxin
VRNVVLLGVAGVVLWGAGTGGSGPGAIEYLQSLSVGERLAAGGAALAALVLGYQAWAIANLRARVSELTDRVVELAASGGQQTIGVELEAFGPPEGAPAPDFDLPVLTGGSANLERLVGLGRPIALIFTSPTCIPCEELMPSVAEWQKDPSLGLAVVVISRGSIETNLEKAEKFGLTNVLLQGEEAEVGEAYGQGGTPCGVIVDTDGRIAKPMVCGGLNITRLVESFQADLSSVDHTHRHATNPPPPVSLGQHVPDIDVRDLAGQRGRLIDYLVGESLLLLWDPKCPFCQSIKSELLKWEGAQSNGSPRLVIVSAGDAAPNAAEGFTSTLLLDDDFIVGDMCAAPGTPSVLLIDENRRVASTVVAGGPGVLEFVQAVGAGLDWHDLVERS